MRRYFKLLIPIVLPVVVIVFALTVLRTPNALSARVGDTGSAASPVSIGMDIGGKNAFESISRADQDGASFVNYGYLSRVSGLSDSLLYSDPNPLNHNETTAHFTYYITATLTSRNVISSVFTVDTAGIVRFYYQDIPYAKFSNPASFAAGTLIAKANIRDQDILNVQSPNQGIATSFGELEQTLANPFTINSQSYQFGVVGLLERVFATGEGTRTNPTAPKSFTVFSGNAVVTGIPGRPLYLPLIHR